MLWHCQTSGPVSSGFEIRFEFRNTVPLRRLDFFVRVEGGGICGDVEGIWPVEVCGAQWQRRTIAYFDMEEGGRR
jgi:hypothetical protein